MKEKFPLFLSLSLALTLLSLLITSKPVPPLSTPTSYSLIASSITHNLLANRQGSQPITLTAVGDIMLGRSVNAKMRTLNNFKYPFLKTANFLRSADITLINLESPFYDNCPTTNTGMIFCADPRAVEGLVFAGVDIANLANNHIRNYGQEGVSLTQNLLYMNKIGFIGPEANFLIKDVKSTRFGFLGFDLTSGYQEGEIIKTVQENSLGVNFLIISLHWGGEYAKQPSLKQVKLAHQIINAGADLILGHHPHVIQRIEDYHGRKIVYSLGNFIFDQPWSEATKRGLVGIFTFENKELIKTEFKEVYIQDYSQPEFLD